MCEGERKSTNDLRLIGEQIYAEVPPTKWNKYKVSDGIQVTAWVTDFVKRVIQLERLKVDPAFGKGGLWFGGLLYPEAFLTATRQAVAQDNGWSLDDLELKYELNLDEERLANNSQGFVVTEMFIEGAEFNTNEDRIKLSEKLSSTLPTANLKWIHKD